MQEPDLKTLMADVHTIKTILQNQDAPFPRVWKGLFTAASVLTLVALVQYLVPFFRDLDFEGKALWLWAPAALVTAPILLTILHRELARAGKAILSQARIKHLLYARFIVPPAALLLLWVTSRTPDIGTEGPSLLLVAIWQTVLEQMFPPRFRAAPFFFLGLGTLELVAGWRGPEVTLINLLLLAATIFGVGLGLRAQTEGR